MSEYILTEEAERDLNEIWEYIAAESINSADSVVREIREGIELVAFAPGIGHQRRDVRDRRYRFWKANRFIIAYFRDTRPLQIVRIVGATRDFRKIFRKSRK
ncbi:MAG TPA: type II toxin-antitoxin system RelE/ParE family toxin [Tepidisphaeraceae bacterium]|jgi:plasmid stabilization system protein ParE|nr:type II toxin-antitoxin system RelE/ParE family toxin [Tepidisphaeraceae bacterium]